jgi:hypothetical protein
MGDIALAWGDGRICLRLPDCLVAIEGLSDGQQQRIFDDYAMFVVAGKEPCEPDVVCCATRLEEPLRLPSERFAVGGQYTPIVAPREGGVEILGFDSLAHIARLGTKPLRASLAVANENDFAKPFVLENFLRVLLAGHVLERGGVLLHSVGVLVAGRAYLFSGRSNAGKTTLARKAELAGASVLSDDINLIVPEQGDYRAHRVPFTGEFGRRAENLAGAGSYLLGGLALLEKGQALAPSPVSSASAVAGLLAGCPFVNHAAEEFPVLSDVLTRLVAAVPVARVAVARDDPFDAIMAALLRQFEHGG